MSSLQRLIITYNGTKADFQSQSDLAPGRLVAVNNFVDFLAGLVGGQRMGALLSWVVGAVQAHATFTHTGTATNGQIGTLLNVNLTAVTSSADPALGQFNISATPATQAASMVVAINTISTLTGKVTATNALGVVTVVSTVPGIVGNGLQISAGNLSNVAAAAFSAGSEGTAYSQDLR